MTTATKAIAPIRRRKLAAAKPKPSTRRRTIAAVSGGALLAAGALVLLKTRTRLFEPKRPSVGRTILDVLTSPPTLIGFGGAVGLGLFRWQMGRLFAEQAIYNVESHVGPDEVEIRSYPPQVVAETVVQAETFRDALDKGFEVLADYIFGNNATGEEIEMTTPVTQTRQDLPKRDLPTDLTMNEDGSWLVRFKMPEGASLASLPSPLNHEVRLRALPARRVATLRYQGTFNDQETEQMQLRLLANLKTQGLKAAGEPGFAGYDAPWTLPFLRRNEAWVELQQYGQPAASPASVS